VLGVPLRVVDGKDDGVILGTDDGQLPHEALHVWKKSVSLHLFVFARSQVLTLFLK